MKEFKSKVGYSILIPILILYLGIVLLPVINHAPLGAIMITVAVMVPILALTLQVFFGTIYRINDQNELLIKCGFLYHSVVDITSIKTIHKTRNAISSPAASLDRIELKYGSRESVIVSPKDKVGFLNELLNINPEIQHDLR